MNSKQVLQTVSMLCQFFKIANCVPVYLTLIG
jgi:hypothetical protein